VSGGDAADEGRQKMAVQATSTALAPASIGARVVAFIIDAIVLGLCQWVLGLIIGDISIVGGLTRAIIYAAFGFLYFGYSWTAWRASPGQRVLGLMTVNDADGAALTWSQATMRWAYLFGPSVLNTLFGNQLGGGIGAIVGLIVLVYYVYLLYTAATDARRQGYHDKQAKTLVAVRTVA
jgi:uncharacterized RDD family membrane protein YckC